MNTWTHGKNLNHLFLQRKNIIIANDFNINDNDVNHIKNVCKTFKINKLGKYHDLYLASDTSLLADVFENFIDKCLAVDNLDPVYYLSAPALSWQSGLKMTGKTLELLSDENMLLMFEKGIRGGAISKFAEANNKYMKNYDSNKESTYLMYVDAIIYMDMLWKLRQR